MNPLTLARKRTPSSTAPESFAAATAGTSVGPKTLQGQPPLDALAVVNDQLELAASALPARSFTRGSVPPPRTVAVYVVAAASGALGVSVAVDVPGL